MQDAGRDAVPGVSGRHMDRADQAAGVRGRPGGGVRAHGQPARPGLPGGGHAPDLRDPGPLLAHARARRPFRHATGASG